VKLFKPEALKFFAVEALTVLLPDFAAAPPELF
jgi:hypothetical protein